MRIIADLFYQSRPQRIRYDVARDRAEVFVGAQGVIVVTGLPNRTANLMGGDRLHAADDARETAVAQFEQPVQMIWHQDECPCLGPACGIRLLEAADHTAGAKQLIK